MRVYVPAVSDCLTSVGRASSPFLHYTGVWILPTHCCLLVKSQNSGAAAHFTTHCKSWLLCRASSNLHHNMSIHVTRQPSNVTRCEGGCHCGAVRFQVLAPTSPTVIDCNCSICLKKQNKHFLVPSSSFKLLSGHDCLTTYSFNTHTAKHTFCSVCGVQSFHIPSSPPDSYGVAPHCLDDGAIKKVTYKKVDGKSSVPAVHKDSNSDRNNGNTTAQSSPNTVNKNLKNTSQNLTSEITDKNSRQSTPKTSSRDKAEDKKNKKCSNKNSTVDKALKLVIQKNSSVDKNASKSPASSQSDAIKDTRKQEQNGTISTSGKKQETTQASSTAVTHSGKKEGDSSRCYTVNSKRINQGASTSSSASSCSSSSITSSSSSTSSSFSHRNFIVTKVDDKNYVQFLHMNSIPRQDNEVSLL
nr:myosin-G heavy chain-like [Cherax quadricarinatus]